jgi:alpha-L-fucosidase
MYTKNSEVYKHHIATYGTPDKFGYKDFIPMFKAEHFDPVAWATLFKATGAKYVIPVAEHHDGFAMYDSELSDWTAVKMGPHRDVIGELGKAVRDQGMHFGISSHRFEHDFFLGVGRAIKSDINDPNYIDFYGPAQTRLENPETTPVSNDFTFVSKEWTDDWLARSAEIIDKYKPDIIYLDWWVGHPVLRPNLARFAAYYYNQSGGYAGHPGVINYKDYAMQEHSGVLDVERGQLSDIRQLHWQSDTSVSNKTWGYIRDDEYKTPLYIVHQLVDIVSKNGNFLLNVGPRSDGTIPEEVQHILLETGAWMKMNGEAIYGSRPWKIYGEGPTKTAVGAFQETTAKPFTAADFRFTTKGKTLYAIELGWPANREAIIHSLASRQKGGGKIIAVTLLGSPAHVTFRQQKDGLHIQLPVQAPGKYAYTYRIEFADA